ncbi:MAG: hypothetical protein RL385_4313 [Pseudomonadota bacterium]
MSTAVVEASDITALEAQFSAARTALAMATRHVEAAQATFDVDDSDSSLRNLRKARESEDTARERLQRAERLLRAGHQQVIAQHRKALEAREAELLGKININTIGPQRKALEDEERQHTKAAGEVFARRVAFESEINRNHQELVTVMAELFDKEPHEIRLSNPAVDLVARRDREYAQRRA